MATEDRFQNAQPERIEAQLLEEDGPTQREASWAMSTEGLHEVMDGTSTDSAGIVNHFDGVLVDRLTPSSEVPTAESAAPVDYVTVLRCETDEHRATKLFVADLQGRVTKHDYAAGHLLRVELHPVSGIEDVCDLVAQIEADPRAFLIRAAPRPDVTLSWRNGAYVVDRLLRRTKHDDGSGAPPGFVPCPRRWVMLDYDGIPLPEGLDVHADPDAVMEHVLGLLPPEFQDVTLGF